MAVVFTDSFTGTNGAPWNAAKWDLRGTPDIQSNTGRMLVTSGNQAARSIMTDLVDLEMLVKVVRPTTSEFYVSHWLRGSSWNLAADPGPSNGYDLEINASGLRLLKRVAGFWTVLTSNVAAPTGTIWVRFRVEGSAIRGRVWVDGSTEPTTWAIDVVDTSVAGVGRSGLTLYGGAAAVTVDARWDDLSVQNLDSIAPVVVSRSIDGSILTVVYDEPLDPAFVPSSNAFVCKVGGVERAVTGVSLSGSDVQLTLASPVVGNDMVTLSYTS